MGTELFPHGIGEEGEEGEEGSSSGVVGSERGSVRKTDKRGENSRYSKSRVQVNTVPRTATVMRLRYSKTEEMASMV